MNARWLTVVLLLTASQGNAQEPEISRARVERFITALADDDMQGRSAFGPSIGRAADLIAAEFAGAGLEPMSGEGGFLQTFQVQGFVLQSSEIEMDDEPVSPDRFVVSIGATSVDWSDAGPVAVTRVTSEDDSGALIRALQGAGGDVLVLVDEAHAATFEQIRPFLEGPRFRLGEPESPTRIVVMGAAEATTFSVRATATAESRELANVVGRLAGRRSDEVVLFSAHYDHIGIRPAIDGDSIANGANDDGSGTTAVVSLAHYFSSLGVPERTLMFVAFTAEEIGGFGSGYFSQQLDPDQIVAMFNVEMIGKPAVSGPNTAWISGWERSDFGPILQRAVEGTEFTFYADPYPEQNLFYRSDNATLARLGVPAHSLSTTPIDVDTDYHTVTDEVHTLDLDHMTNTIRAIAAGARTIVSGQETPTRLDPATVN